MNLPLNIFSTTLTVLTGLVIYAFYASCDPGSTGEISKDDEVHIFHLFKALIRLLVSQAVEKGTSRSYFPSNTRVGL